MHHLLVASPMHVGFSMLVKCIQFKIEYSLQYSCKIYTPWKNDAKRSGETKFSINGTNSEFGNIYLIYHFYYNNIIMLNDNINKFFFFNF
jgi:hypothetical protein